MVLIKGKISTKLEVDYDQIIVETLEEIGYTKNFGFEPKICNILLNLKEQILDVVQGQNYSIMIM